MVLKGIPVLARRRLGMGCNFQSRLWHPPV